MIQQAVGKHLERTFEVLRAGARRGNRLNERVLTYSNIAEAGVRVAEQGLPGGTGGVQASSLSLADGSWEMLKLSMDCEPS